VIDEAISSIRVTMRLQRSLQWLAMTISDVIKQCRLFHALSSNRLSVDIRSHVPVCKREIITIQWAGHPNCASQALYGFLGSLSESDFRPRQLPAEVEWHTLLQFLLPQCKCL